MMTLTFAGCNLSSTQTSPDNTANSDDGAPVIASREDSKPSNTPELTEAEKRRKVLIETAPRPYPDVIYSDVIEAADGTTTYFIENDVRFHKIIEKPDGSVEYFLGRKRTPRDIPLKPDKFEPLFKGDVGARAAALGAGPYRIGKSLNGYSSDPIKKAFDLYDRVRTIFVETVNKNPDICDFTKAALFSENIDLSEFYWHHPNAGDVPLQKYDTHTYRMTDLSELFISFAYNQYGLSSGHYTPKSVVLSNPIISLCDVTTDSKRGENQFIYNRNNLAATSEISCSTEYNTNSSDNAEPIFSRNYPGSTIGFFLYDSGLYAVHIQLFKYARYSTHSIEASRIAIVTSKIEYNQIPQMKEFKRVCEYSGRLPEK